MRKLFIVLFILGIIQSVAGKDEKKVRGKVVNTSGEALIGVSVRHKKTGRVAQTKPDGAFEITVPASAVLTFSYIGSGYTAAPTVTITGGGGTGAVITATLLPRPNNARADLPASLSKDAFFQAVVKERAFELAFEGTRRTDLIRWNLLGSKIAETDQRLNAYRTNYVYLAGDYFMKNKHELYPIPLNEIEVNRAIVQNPGY